MQPPLIATIDDIYSPYLLGHLPSFGQATDPVGVNLWFVPASSTRASAWIWVGEWGGGGGGGGGGGNKIHSIKTKLSLTQDYMCNYTKD